MFPILPSDEFHITYYALVIRKATIDLALTGFIVQDHYNYL